MVDSEDRIKLIDFGIASNARSKASDVWEAHRTMGTADYISPEQVKSNRSDARSDLYAVGVMLYEMLTGEVPFQGANPLAVMNDRLLNDPIPPREVNPQISAQLQEIIYRALERNPANRYASAREFATDLRNPDSVGVDGTQRAEKLEKRRSVRAENGFGLCGAGDDPRRHLRLTSDHRSRPLNIAGRFSTRW